jgi:hypothetical protein
MFNSNTTFHQTAPYRKLIPISKTPHRNKLKAKNIKKYIKLVGVQPDN